MDFAPEILEKIFLHLDITSLKSCLLVSKYFRESILNSPYLMKKLPLKLNSENWKLKLEFLKKFGNKIKKMEITNNDENCELIKLLHFTPMALAVEINWISRDKVVDSMDYEILAEFMEIKLEKIEKLKILLHKVNAELLFRQLLNSTKNVKKLCIRCDETIHECTSIVAFLTQQLKLEELELKFGKYDDIFSRENVQKLKFKLRKFVVVPGYHCQNDFEYFNQFLLMQSQSLTELSIFSARCEERIANSIYSLQNLKRLSTHTILPCFQFGFNNDIDMRSLTHYRYYLGNTNESLQSISAAAFPNLELLNVHLGIGHRLCGVYSDKKVTMNPLSNLPNLRRFHIESRNIDVLKHLSSRHLEVLATSYENELFDKNNWKKMAKNLPNLSTLIVENIRQPFLKVICDIEKFLKKINLQFLILREHFDCKTVLIFQIRKGEIFEVQGYYCNGRNSLLENEKGFRKKFRDFKLICLYDHDYDKYFEFWNCYFYSYGP